MTQQEDLTQRLLSSDTKADLVALFRRNPGLIDTLDGIASRIGKRSSAVETEVDDLISLGLLRTRKMGSREAIFRDEKKDAEIQELVAAQLRGATDGGDTHSHKDGNR